MIPAFFNKPINFHPESLTKVADLPASLRSAAAAALPPGSAIKGIFFVPADYRSRGFFGYRYIPEQALLFTERGVLHVQAGVRREDTPSANFIAAECLLYTHSSLLLLYGRLELAAAAGESLTRVVVEYNTVGWRLLEPCLKEFLAAAGELPSTPADPTATRAHAEDLLEALPFKFANGVRLYGLSGAEHLLAVVFQPAIWQSGRWGLRQRQVTPNTLLALTDCNLILIEEDRALFRRATGRVEYGWIISHLPRRSILSAGVSGTNDLQDLRITLGLGAAQAERHLLLDADTARSWTAIWGTP